MNVLIIGGNRFLGLELGFRLLAAGHHLTLLNRGTRPDPFGARVERLKADRGTDQFGQALVGRTFDAVVDFALFTGAEARRAARVLEGRVGHWVVVSTGQVYLVRKFYAPGAREDFYDGPLVEPPEGPYDLEQWRYGAEKRAAEDVVAGSGIPATRLRLPMVHGLNDYSRRIESYLWRLLDGGPLLLPNGEGPARHVYAPAVARAIQRVLGDASTFGQAYNLSQDETPTVRELVLMIAGCLGAQPDVVPIEEAALAEHGLTATGVSPFSGRWMSCLDSSKARAQLGFAHEPLAAYLPGLVHALLQRWPLTPPTDLQQRAIERGVGKQLKR